MGWVMIQAKHTDFVLLFLQVIMEKLSVSNSLSLQGGLILDYD